MVSAVIVPSKNALKMYAPAIGCVRQWVASRLALSRKPTCNYAITFGHHERFCTNTSRADSRLVSAKPVTGNSSIWTRAASVPTKPTFTMIERYPYSIINHDAWAIISDNNKRDRDRRLILMTPGVAPVNGPRFPFSGTRIAF